MKSMPLNFDKLNALARDMASTTPEERPDHKKATSIYSLQSQADEIRALKEQERSLFSIYQNNIKCAGQLRCEILKGVKDNSDLSKLFLKAVECISHMTNDPSFYEQIKKYISENNCTT